MKLKKSTNLLKTYILRYTHFKNFGYNEYIKDFQNDFILESLDENNTIDFKIFISILKQCFEDLLNINNNYFQYRIFNISFCIYFLEKLCKLVDLLILRDIGIHILMN